MVPGFPVPSNQPVTFPGDTLARDGTPTTTRPRLLRLKSSITHRMQINASHHSQALQTKSRLQRWLIPWGRNTGIHPMHPRA